MITLRTIPVNFAWNERGRSMEQVRKKMGLGSLSMAFVLLGLFWSFSFQGFCAGDWVLNMIGLPAWSSGGMGGTGSHLTLVYSLLFFLPAFLLGRRNPNDFGARTGRTISLGLGALMILCALIYAAG